jgi:DNA repair ATPase RecN
LNITRLRVEEGFFDGLDLSFESGLNVIIGGRGVGKTSIIELVRFALGVSGSYAHAISVLQSGQVTVDLDINGYSFSVARSAADLQPRSAYQFPPPLFILKKKLNL